MNRTELCRAALQFFGNEHQIRKCMEELSELSVAVCHCYDGKDSVRHVAEEIADVENLIEQMKILFNCHDQVDRQRRFKLEALANKMSLTFQEDCFNTLPVKVGDKVWFICWDKVANAWVLDEDPYPIEEVGTKGFFVSYDDEDPVEFDEYVLYEDIGDECFLSYEDAVAAAAVKAPKEIRFEENPVPDEGEDHD